jgi:hypothetical protein
VPSYRGSAWVTNPDGEEIEVHAVLDSRMNGRGLVSWDGTLAGPADWFALQGRDLVPMRIGERTADVNLSHVDLADPLAAVIIRGSGPPPFG